MLSFITINVWNHPGRQTVDVRGISCQRSQLWGLWDTKAFARMYLSLILSILFIRVTKYLVNFHWPWVGDRPHLNLLMVLCTKSSFLLKASLVGRGRLPSSFLQSPNSHLKSAPINLTINKMIVSDEWIIMKSYSIAILHGLHVPSFFAFSGGAVELALNISGKSFTQAERAGRRTPRAAKSSNNFCKLETWALDKESTSSLRLCKKVGMMFPLLSAIGKLRMIDKWSNMMWEVFDGALANMMLVAIHQKVYSRKKNRIDRIMG